LFPLILAIGMLYPFFYDMGQLFRSPKTYFDDPWNWSDFAFNIFGVANIILQVSYEDAGET